MPMPLTYDQITKTLGWILNDMVPDGTGQSTLLRHDPDPVHMIPARKWSKEELQPIADETSMPCILDDTPTFYLTMKSTDTKDQAFAWVMMWIDIPEYRLHRDDNLPCIIAKWPNGNFRLLVTATHGKITKWEEFDEDGICDVSQAFFPYADDRVVGVRNC